MVIVMPHRLHIIKIDTENITVVIAKVAIVTVNAQAVLYAWRSTVATIAQCRMKSNGGITHLIFIYGTILTRPEEKTANHHRRGVKSTPSPTCLVVGTGGERTTMLPEVKN